MHLYDFKKIINRIQFKSLFENGHEFKLIDGVLKLIQHYKQNGITLVLASSASMANINMIFKKFDLDQYFKAKISGADLKASKPHPEIFEKAAKLTGHSKKKCLVIEDATNGIIAAKSAGIFCIAFDGGHSKNQDYNILVPIFILKIFSQIDYKINDYNY